MYIITARVTHNHCSFLQLWLVCGCAFPWLNTVKNEEKKRERANWKRTKNRARISTESKQSCKAKHLASKYKFEEPNWLVMLYTLCFCSPAALTLTLTGIFSSNTFHFSHIYLRQHENRSHFDVPAHISRGYRNRCSVHIYAIQRWRTRAATSNMCSIAFVFVWNRF